jgi:hypothetical protein
MYRWIAESTESHGDKSSDAQRTDCTSWWCIFNFDKLSFISQKEMKGYAQSVGTNHDGSGHEPPPFCVLFMNVSALPFQHIDERTTGFLRKSFGNCRGLQKYCERHSLLCAWKWRIQSLVQSLQRMKENDPRIHYDEEYQRQTEISRYLSDILRTYGPDIVCLPLEAHIASEAYKNYNGTSLLHWRKNMEGQKRGLCHFRGEIEDESATAANKKVPVDPVVSYFLAAVLCPWITLPSQICLPCSYPPLDKCLSPRLHLHRGNSDVDEFIVGTFPWKQESQKCYDEPENRLKPFRFIEPLCAFRTTTHMWNSNISRGYEDSDLQAQNPFCHLSPERICTVKIYVPSKLDDIWIGLYNVALPYAPFANFCVGALPIPTNFEKQHLIGMYLPLQHRLLLWDFQ